MAFIFTLIFFQSAIAAKKCHETFFRNYDNGHQTSVERIRKVKQVLKLQSLDTPLNHDTDTLHIDIIPSRGRILGDPLRIVMEWDWRQKFRQALTNSDMTVMELRIVRDLYFSDPPKTYDEIAQERGVARQTIYNRVKKIKPKLRKIINALQ